MTVAPVREVAASGAGPSVIATFSDATPLGSTHLLVAVTACAGSASSVGGWTTVWTATANGLNRSIATRQADGIVNSVGLSGMTGPGAIVLMAFDGFTSATPSAIGDAATGATATAAAADPLILPAAKGVAVAAGSAYNTGPIAPTNWTWGGGYTKSAVAPLQYASAGWKSYDPASGVYDASATLNAVFRWAMRVAIFDLTGPTSRAKEAIGDTPVTLSLGATDLTGAVGATG
ncbi:MAG: hypothetical protein K0S49_6 [Microbacterium sp.]|jgi:hypothetical protein|nr:hypothetical protein [Microbacterium sp.]